MDQYKVEFQSDKKLVCYAGKKIGISGAGLVGSLWALFLARKGFNVELFERRPDMRRAGIQGGRSINLALSDRGWRALNEVNLGDKVKKVAIPMYGRMIHTEKGELNFLPYGKENQAIYSVSRSGLNQLMMDEAENSRKVKIHFNQKCTGVNFEKGNLFLKDRNKGISYDADVECIFGADGAFSPVRRSLMKTDRFNYRQFYIDHGYKELNIPPGKQQKWQMEKNALHIWPRKKFMLIALPNLDGSFTVTLFLAFEGAVSFEQLNNAGDVKAFFDEYFSDAKRLMPTLTGDFFQNPTSSLITVRCNPWHYKDRVCLLGDAAHAIVPFYGQGMNAGFEDCTVLNELVNRYSGNWEKVFAAFTENRIKDADAISELALQNFVEMRDLVADTHFLKKRKLSRKLQELLPGKWKPLYSMVTFSHLPYSEALNKGKIQDKILEKILQDYDIEKILNSPELTDIASQYITAEGLV